MARWILIGALLVGATALAKPKPPEAKLPAVDSGECGAICKKLLQCKVGPWTNESDCDAACDGAREDDVASKVYRCVARATSCKAVRKCAK